MKRLYLNITDFAVPSPLVGSIEAHSGYGGLPDAGSKIHADIQASRQEEFPGYEPEKRVNYDFTQGESTISVSGRMDGFRNGDPDWIEEIKSAYQIDKLLEKLTGSQDHPYRRQLQTYAYIHWKETGRMPHLTFCAVDSRSLEQKQIDVPFDIKEYEEWLARRLAEIVEKEEIFEAARKRRKRTAKKMAFPFPLMRSGQRELIDLVSEKLTDKNRLVLQAPTGLGKTVGVMLPALADSLTRGQKLIYVTAKNSQHEAAEDAVERFQDAGADIRSLTVLAKSKMCFKEEVLCDPAYCEFAKDHYRKMAEGKLTEQVLKKKKLNERSIKKIAAQHEVCPFDLQMEAAAAADVVIGDYNYVFSPYHARGRLLKTSLGRTSSQPNLVVDEAHNLPDRAADYFSAEISSHQVRLAHQDGHTADVSVAIAELGQELENYFSKISTDLPMGPGPYLVHPTQEDFVEVKAKTQHMLAEYLASDEPLRQNDAVVGLYNAVMEFGDLLESMREEFFCTYHNTHNNRSLHLVCCDAAFWLKEAYDEFAHVIAFSATLKPFEYYQRTLGLEDSESGEFQSPFPKENRKIILIPQVSTKWRDRAGSSAKIREIVEKIVTVKPGNYFVFFPSFDFMQMVAGTVSIEGFEIITQRRDMNRRDVEAVIQSLRSKEKPTVVFAVQGGVFSEGVDYPGDALIGAIVVGPALPVFSFEREQLRAYYEKKFGTGFDYAYTYPAMARTVQSAGRVIRSGEDKGLIVLIDRRFLETSYAQAMPGDWIEESPQELVSSRIIEDVREFWDKDI